MRASTAVAETGCILSRVATGDKSSIEECIEAYGKLVWALARRLSPSHADAEDAVQEIFIDVWRSAARFDATISSETAFITMIARRRLIDRLRKSQREFCSSSLDHETAHEVRDTKPLHDRQTEICVEAALAAQAMKELRPEQQRILGLAIYQGLSHQEIALETGMPLGTVKTHARRGLLQIREVLGHAKIKSAEGASK